MDALNLCDDLLGVLYCQRKPIKSASGEGIVCVCVSRVFSVELNKQTQHTTSCKMISFTCFIFSLSEMTDLEMIFLPL